MFRVIAYSITLFALLLPTGFFSPTAVFADTPLCSANGGFAEVGYIGQELAQNQIFVPSNGDFQMSFQYRDSTHTFDKNAGYYVDLMNGSAVLATTGAVVQLGGSEEKGSAVENPPNVYTFTWKADQFNHIDPTKPIWDAPNGSNLHIELVKDSLSTNNEICQSTPLITVRNQTLSQVGTCDVKMSDQYHAKSNLDNITVSARKLPGIEYAFNIDKGDMSQTITSKYSDPNHPFGFPIADLQGAGVAAINPFNFDAVDSGTSNIKTINGFDANTTPYTAFVIAWDGSTPLVGEAVRQGYVCGLHVFKSNNDQTTDPTVTPISGANTPGKCCPRGYTADACKDQGDVDKGFCCAVDSTGKAMVDSTGKQIEALRNNSCAESGSSGTYCDITTPKQTVPDPTQISDQTHRGVSTAIGCIPTDPPVLIGALLRFAASAGGGISLLLMIFGAFRIILSAGNPEAVKKGREQFVAAFMGLLFILFAVAIIQVLGVDILQIPGFH